MKFSSLPAAAAAFAGICRAIEDVEAARVVYFYTVYDLDVKVWGQGNHTSPLNAKELSFPTAVVHSMNSSTSSIWARPAPTPSIMN
jgi:hypothetical protein